MSHFDFSTQLDREAAQKEDVDLLFCGYDIEDISSDSKLRKLGADFILKVSDRRVLCENKFEAHATGRVVYELISVDRPKLTPGWLFTSSAAWVLSWFPSGELLAVHMDELREKFIPTLQEVETATAKNRSYLTWSALTPIQWVLRHCESSRVLDLNYNLRSGYSEFLMVSPAWKHKIVDVDDLVLHMQGYNEQSTPRLVTTEELVSFLPRWARANRCRKQHVKEVADLQPLYFSAKSVA